MRWPYWWEWPALMDACFLFLAAIVAIVIAVVECWGEDKK